jgi:hypothetical protein
MEYQIEFLGGMLCRGLLIPSKALEHWIIAGNIERYQKQLEAETDPEKRQLLEHLLVAERAKLGFKPPG